MTPTARRLLHETAEAVLALCDADGPKSFQALHDRLHASLMADRTAGGAGEERSDAIPCGALASGNCHENYCDRCDGKPQQPALVETDIVRVADMHRASWATEVNGHNGRPLTHAEIIQIAAKVTVSFAAERLAISRTEARENDETFWRDSSAWWKKEAETATAKIADLTGKLDAARGDDFSDASELARMRDVNANLQSQLGALYARYAASAAIPEAVRERAREITPKLPNDECIRAAHRVTRFLYPADLEALADAAQLVREIAQ